MYTLLLSEKIKNSFKDLLTYVLCIIWEWLHRWIENMSDIRDILELDQGLASVPTKEAIVGGNKVNLFFLLIFFDEFSYFLHWWYKSCLQSHRVWLSLL